MKKTIKQNAWPLSILLGRERFRLTGNKGNLSRNYLAVQLLLTIVILISIGCKKDDRSNPPVTALASLTTTAVSTITQTTAQSGGNITTDGGASITARGICWGKATNPTTANDKTTIGTGTGIFSSFITGLTASTIYFVRAYATNSAGTVYGNEISFTTLPVSANTVTDIDGNIYPAITIGTQV